MTKLSIKNKFCRFISVGFLLVAVSGTQLSAQNYNHSAQPVNSAHPRQTPAPTQIHSNQARVYPTQVVLAPPNAPPVSKIIDLRTENPQKASTSVKTRQALVQKLPIRQMLPDSQRKINSVLNDVTMYRRLPVETIPCDEELYVFLTKQPDVVVNLWEVMRISNIRLREMEKNRFYLEDQAGTQGTMECLYRSDNMIVIYVVGTYEGVPFPTKVTGSGVIVLQHESSVGPDGERKLSVRLDSFIRIHNGAVDFLAKTFQGPVGKVADSNLQQTMGFVGALARTIKHDGESVERVSHQLQRVRPEVRKEFAQITREMMRRRDLEIFGGPIPIAIGTSQGEWLE